MGFGETLLILFCVYYTMYTFSLFSKRKRTIIQATNIKLDDLRTIPCKTLEEQKQFIDLKYPKKTKKYKFEWIHIPKIIFRIALFIFVFKIYQFLIGLTHWDIKIWHAFLFVTIFPIFYNMILSKFNVQKSDLMTMIRGRKK